MDEVLHSPCIARFTRVNDATTAVKEESEIATIMHLEQKTSIQVPRILHYDTDISNDIGAAYVLMGKLPGKHLYEIWHELTLPHKKKALSDIAAVIAQFALLHYNSIGAFQLHGPQTWACL
ncbi:hypothetical protein GQ53DRAFT_819358 [Thozetella sp. PMI_491]|nr:hypothetical protein GQ53DRAFT_819358 [Thozetella sp. PMI_491]